MSYRIQLFATLFFCLTNTITGQTFENNYFYYKPNPDKQNGKWIMLLPGSSGLTIFDDKTFYNRQAKSFSNDGYSVLLIDYKSFYKSSIDKSKPNSKSVTSEKIAWVVKQVIILAQSKSQIDTSQYGHLLGWSLAGEGIFTLLKDDTFIKKNKIKSVALFYPSNQRGQSIATTIPLLIQIGQEDNVVNAEKLRSQISDNNKIQFIVYPNSSHGFDIETLTSERKIKFPPLIGKKYIFKYNEDVSHKAKKELIDFLNK